MSYCYRHLMLSCISDFSLHSGLGCTFWLMHCCCPCKHDFTLNMISLWWTPGVFVVWIGPGHTGFSFIQLQLPTITPMSWLSLRRWKLCVSLGLYQPASAHLSFSQFGPHLSPFVGSATPQLAVHQLRQRILTTPKTSLFSGTWYEPIALDMGPWCSW